MNKMTSDKRKWPLASAALAFAALALSAPAVAAQGNGGGGGKGGGDDGGAPDYGDLLILYRDANGVPVPSAEVLVPDPETPISTVPGGQCWQPIAAEEFSYDGWTLPSDRVVVPSASTPADDGSGWLVPVDQYTCGVEAFFATHTQEVDFGRTNEARSPESVFAAQLEDVVIKLATADSTSLDPAGRMVASTCGEGEATVTSTIDSPLQNLAVYRQLMLTGAIGAALPEGADVFDTAARGLGVAADKSGKVNVDMVAYLNMIMGLDVADTILPKLEGTYREEVQGTIQLVTRSFLDYSNYSYNRDMNFQALPSPEYIGEAEPTAGEFEYLWPVPQGGQDYFEILKGQIWTAVFNDEAGFGDGNIGGFAQAADDTRAVIQFMHDWPIPDADVYGTPVPCYADPDLITYDVSISDESGLQVPKMMVDGSEGREFFVTVANAGPDAASGTVTVIAAPANGESVAGSPWIFEFDLAAGSSHGFTQFFTVALGERTTIDWTAVAVAEYDVNLGNNTVTAKTSVKLTSGGGGGH